MCQVVIGTQGEVAWNIMEMPCVIGIFQPPDRSLSLEWIQACSDGSIIQHLLIMCHTMDREKWHGMIEIRSKGDNSYRIRNEPMYVKSGESTLDGSTT
jgi:hypothetical protein